MKAENRQIPQRLAARLKFAYCLHKWVCPLLGFVSVAQKNKPLTMSLFVVQSIDLPMEYMV